MFSLATAFMSYATNPALSSVASWMAIIGIYTCIVSLFAAVFTSEERYTFLPFAGTGLIAFVGLQLNLIVVNHIGIQAFAFASCLCGVGLICMIFAEVFASRDAVS
jgi:hypothetical protein